MTKPLIGILPLYDEKLKSWWMLQEYLDAVMDAGGIPVVLSAGTESDFPSFADRFDGFLFTGGQDVSPALYGQEKLPVCGVICKERDNLEKAVFESCRRNRVPALGICRGAQVFNVLMGGTLYQDLPSQHPSNVVHEMKKPYDAFCHSVSILDHTPLKELVGVSTLSVNSMHHQGIRRVGEHLIPMAVSEDGIVEAVAADDQPFLMAVQWHPEYLYQKDAASRKIFEAFLDACRISMQKKSRS